MLSNKLLNSPVFLLSKLSGVETEQSLSVEDLTGKSDMVQTLREIMTDDNLIEMIIIREIGVVQHFQGIILDRLALVFRSDQFSRIRRFSLIVNFEILISEGISTPILAAAPFKFFLIKT